MRTYVVVCVLALLAISLLFKGGAYLDAQEQKKQELRNQEWITSSVLLERGINSDEPYPLLALTRESERITRAQGNLKGGGSFFFLVGDASVSGSYSQTTQNEYFVGFVADMAGQPVVLRLPASKFDFRFAQVEQPQIRFFVRETIWGNLPDEVSLIKKEALEAPLTRDERVGLISTTHILEQDLGRVVITLSQEQFREDVAVLKYAYQGTR